jgi:hypothetical protein
MGNLTCGDRANSLPVTPATVSHHWKVLKQVELIAGLEALQLQTAARENQFLGAIRNKRAGTVQWRNRRSKRPARILD